MIVIADTLKEAFNPNSGQGARYIDYSVEFSIINHEAMAEIQLAADQDTPISRMAQLTNRDVQQADYITFEGSGWPLDGSKVVPPRVSEVPDAEIGLIMPELSGADGAFADEQVFVASTTNTHNAIAITVDFGWSIVSDFSVYWFAGDTEITHIDIADNENSSAVVNTAVSGFDRVEVRMKKTAIPFRRAKLVEFVFGAVSYYTKQNTDSVALTEVIDPFNERAPAKELKIVADNFAREYNIFDPTGIYSYFLERMPLDVQIGARQEDRSYGYVPMGIYYLQAPRLSGNMSKLELNAADLLGSLQDMHYSKGTYKTASLGAFINDIAQDAGVNVVYPGDLNNVTVTAYLASGSHAEALRCLAQAANCILHTNRDDQIALERLDNISLQTIGRDDYRVENGISPSDDQILNTVHISSHSIRPSADGPKEVAKVPISGSITSAVYYVDNALITTTAGSYVIRYNPSISHSATIQNGELIITGTELVDTPVIVSRNNRGPLESEYSYSLDNNVFIQSANVNSVADYFLRLKCDKRRMVRVEYRGYPYIEMGDILDFDYGTGTTQPFFVTKNALQLGGGMTASMEARER